MQTARSRMARAPCGKAGICSHVRATTVDIFPTIAAIAHVKDPLPKGIEGGSLAKDRAKEATELGRKLDEYLKAIGALMPVPNPNYDPAKAKPFEARRGPRG